MPYLEENYDAVVVGAGHAGCEAALACARLGLETIMFTVSVDSIALMPCNPNVGGSSKGHLVRELDALGGEMGKNIEMYCNSFGKQKLAVFKEKALDRVFNYNNIELVSGYKPNSKKYCVLDLIDDLMSSDDNKIYPLDPDL